MRKKSVVLVMLLFIASTGAILSPASARVTPHMRCTVVGVQPDYPTLRSTFESEVVEMRAERNDRVFVVGVDVQFVDSRIPGGRVFKHSVIEFWVSVTTGRVLYYHHARTTYYVSSGAMKDNYTFTVNLRHNGNELTAECAAVVLWKDGAELPDPIHEDGIYTATPDRLNLQDVWMDFMWPVRLPSHYNIGQTFTCFTPYFDQYLFKWQPNTNEVTVTEQTKVTVAAGTFTTYHLVLGPGGSHVYVALETQMCVMLRVGGTVPQTYELTSYSHG